MENRWSDAEARAFVKRYAEHGVNEDLALRVYTSRLIGGDARLVLHGGGNTSVKTRMTDDTGAETPVLCVKGSGWDLGDIEPAGLPAVRLEPLLALREREALSDEQMVNAQRTRLLDASAPNPSVETLLHAFLPHKYVDHSHADAILCLVDQPDAEARCREVFGRRLGIVPYVMPGFALAKLAAEVYEADPEVEGLLLLRHGLFTFGETARESYERHVAAVEAAEACVGEAGWPPAGASASDDAPSEAVLRTLLPVLRGQLGDEGRRLRAPRAHEPHAAGLRRRCRGDRPLAARGGHARPRDPHQAGAAAARRPGGPRRREPAHRGGRGHRWLPGRVPRLRGAAGRAARRRDQAARPRPPRRPRARRGRRHGGRHREGGARGGGPLRAHGRDHPRRRGPRPLQRARRGRSLRHGVLVSRAGEARQGRCRRPSRAAWCW